MSIPMIYGANGSSGYVRNDQKEEGNQGCRMTEKHLIIEEFDVDGNPLTRQSLNYEYDAFSHFAVPAFSEKLY